MEPLSALSVAAAAVQFLDFGARIITDTREVYQSSSRQIRDNVELGEMAKRFNQLTNAIEYKLREFGPEDSIFRQLSHGPEQFGDETEVMLIHLCHQASEIGHELQDLLAKLKSHGKTKIELVANSFVTALKAIWSEEKIEGLKDRLEQTQKQIMMATLVLSWGQAEKNRVTMTEFVNQQALSISKLDSIDRTTQDFGKSMAGLLRGESQLQTRKIVQYVLDTNWQPSKQLKAVARQSIDDASAVDPNKRLGEIVVQSLRFETINNRQEGISRAYTNTYEWIFRNPLLGDNEGPLWSDLSTWLSSPSNQVYWITGKPGAGKSTLVKFMVMDKRLISLLQAWAGPSVDLFLASYFSWNAGNDLQKSLQGLLRTVLHQCLKQCPDLLVPEVFPSRWVLLQLFGERVPLPKWGMEELITGFRALLSQVGRKFSDKHPIFKLAIIIDGLDEFEVADHAPLIELLQEASGYPDVKLCVSSRPWNVFRDAFEQNPMLQLENLTRYDIQAYVNGQFRASLGFQERSILQPLEAKRLLGDILRKAQGVFLWVSVVVRGLLISLQEGDKLSDLQKTVNSLPDDVSTLFQVMWERTNPQYHGEAAQYFSIVETYYKYDLTPYTLGVWLGDDDTSVDLDFHEVDRSFLSSATLSLKRRLNSRTRGLLEIYPWEDFSSGGVDYMHRTVREWVLGNWSNICSSIDPDFDANLWILKGETLRVPIENYIYPMHRPQQFWSHLGKLLDVANGVRDTPANNTKLVQILDKLDTSLSHVVDSSSDSTNDETSHWCNKAPKIEEKLAIDQAQGWNQVDFIGLSAQFPIPQYLKTKLSQDSDVARTARLTVPVLMSAIVGGLSEDPLNCGLTSLSCKVSTRLELMQFLLSFVPLNEVENALSWRLMRKREYTSTVEGLLQAHIDAAQGPPSPSTETITEATSSTSPVLAEQNEREKKSKRNIIRRLARISWFRG
ncbi:hypothetical protein F4819DRAFT_497705 [Hypoxylon fuscum]|nr:hypothetical protein F4819DRAFT_497705 [Hypoxylon fuscum]